MMFKVIFHKALSIVEEKSESISCGSLIFIIITKFSKQDNCVEIIMLRYYKWLVIVLNCHKTLGTFLVYKNRVCYDDKKLFLKR